MSESTLKMFVRDRITYCVTKRATAIELPVLAELCAEFLLRVLELLIQAPMLARGKRINLICVKINFFPVVYI
jgi:hypothetical protein